MIRTQKDRKLQTLICTDFSSLSTTAHLHRPAEQFAVHQQMEAPYTEDDCDSEAVFAVCDRPPWTNRRPPETSGTPTLQQMFALARRMGYEMRPIVRQTDAPRQQPGGRPPVSFSTTDWTWLLQDQVFQLWRVWTHVINHVSHSRMHPYRLSQLVGFSSRMDANRETAIIKRETPLRPGPHPHRSARASLDPHSTYMY